MAGSHLHTVSVVNTTSSCFSFTVKLEFGMDVRQKCEECSMNIDHLTASCGSMLKYLVFKLKLSDVLRK